MKGVLGSLGLVFGDIGTSPIYTLTVIILLTKPDMPHIMGVLSLIVWTLITIVSAQYAWLAMSLSRKGEGGAPSCSRRFSSISSKAEGRPVL